MIEVGPGPMTADILVQFIFFVCLVTMVVFGIRLRRSKLLYIVDYQVGLRPRSDGSSELLQPGAYRSSAGGTPISIVDLRPRQFILERLVFQDMLRASGVISVGGELVIRDPQLAVTAFKNLVEDSLPIVRERLLHVVPRSIIDPSVDGRAKMAASVTADLNRELQSRGVAIEHLEITELWIQAVKFNMPAETN
jgi:hypothetical protein